MRGHFTNGTNRISESEVYVRKDRIIVGVLCLAYAVWIFLSGETGGTVAPAVAFTVLGIWAVATSRRK